MLLHDARSSHPALEIWIKAIIRDPTEQRFINEFADDYRDPERFDGTLREALAEGGWDVSHRGGCANTPIGIAYAIQRRAPKGRRREGEYHTEMDRLYMNLAHAVVIHRQAGRPTGDQTMPLEPTKQLNVTTSLPAQVREYHRAVVDFVFDFAGGCDVY